VWAACEGSEQKQVPREVSYYYLCKEFKCLPGVGGLLDQDPALVEAFILCMNTEGKYQKYQEQKEESKRKLDEKQRKLQGQG
jgi:hypothetical protein